MTGKETSEMKKQMENFDLQKEVSNIFRAVNETENEIFQKMANISKTIDASITAGMQLKKSAILAKKMDEKFLTSNTTKLSAFRRTFDKISSDFMQFSESYKTPLENEKLPNVNTVHKMIDFSIFEDLDRNFENTTMLYNDIREKVTGAFINIETGVNETMASSALKTHQVNNDLREFNIKYGYDIALCQIENSQWSWWTDSLGQNLTKNHKNILMEISQGGEK